MTEAREGTNANQDSGSESKPDIDQIQADIEATRRQLGETVDALSAKMDVKGRTKARLAGVKDQAAVQVGTVKARASELTARSKDAATTAEGKPTPAVTIGTAAVVGGVVAVMVYVVWRRRSR